MLKGFDDIGRNTCYIFMGLGMFG